MNILLIGGVKMRLLSVLLSVTWFLLLGFWVSRCLLKLSAMTNGLVVTLNESIAVFNAKSMAVAAINSS